jgi:hypothetical protein
MAPRKGSGRKPAKNETALALINALNFIDNLKTPPAGSPPQYDYVFLNQGYAIGFDGVVAAGHPIPGDIAGYPHTKLFAEALENTDKTFTLTRRNTGEFEVGSDKYNAVIPVCPADVIPTFPDNKQGPISDPTTLMAALKVVHGIAVDTGTTAVYSAIRITEPTLMATNGQIMLEVRHNNNLPPVVIPRQFVTAILKSNKTPEFIGINGADWSTLTIWFTDGAWLRTNLYKTNPYTDEILNVYNTVTEGMQGYSREDIPPKLWATVKAVLPFAEDNKIMLRPGIVRTHTETHKGAALQLDKLNVAIDVNGKSLLALEELATAYSVGEIDGAYVMAFAGGGVDVPLLRGILAGDAPEVVQEPENAGGWGSLAEAQAAAEGGGWALAEVAPPEEAPARREAAPQGEWVGGPAPNLANDPEFLSQYHDKPAETFMEPVEDAYVFADKDNGIPLAFSPEVETGAFQASAWLNTITEEDGGFK